MGRNGYLVCSSASSSSRGTRHPPTCDSSESSSSDHSSPPHLSPDAALLAMAWTNLWQVFGYRLHRAAKRRRQRRGVEAWWSALTTAVPGDKDERAPTNLPRAALPHIALSGHGHHGSLTTLTPCLPARRERWLWLRTFAPSRRGPNPRRRAETGGKTRRLDEDPARGGRSTVDGSIEARQGVCGGTCCHHATSVGARLTRAFAPEPGG